MNDDMTKPEWTALLYGPPRLCASCSADLRGKTDAYQAVVTTRKSTDVLRFCDPTCYTDWLAKQ